jgi:hypothetical protein
MHHIELNGVSYLENQVNRRLSSAWEQAVELERGWLLSADAGNTLRSIGQTPDLIDHWLKAPPI